MADHLQTCPACQAELQEIRFGIRLAENLPQASAPDSLWDSIQQSLDQSIVADAGDHGRRRSWALAFSLAALVVITGLFSWYFGFRQRLYVAPAVTEPSQFELAAVLEHSRRIQGALHWDLTTADTATLRTWVRVHAGLSASIPDNRPAEDRGHFRLVGARLLQVEGATAAEIGYQLDSYSVTLLTAQLAKLHKSPREAWFSKDVSYRLDTDHGYKVLTWGSDGQAYAMVSSLPGLGHKGCILCHTSAARRKLIDNIAGRLQ
jgi:anti-sigma factor RsiW